jgi:hypothetical protein
MKIDSPIITGSFISTGSIVTTGSVQGNIPEIVVASNTASLDLTLGNFFKLQLVDNENIHFEINNILPGQTANIVIYTAVSGTLSFSDNILQPQETMYTPSEFVTKDILTLLSFDSNEIFVAGIKNLG